MKKSISYKFSYKLSFLIFIQLVLLTTNVFANPLPKEWYFAPIENDLNQSTKDDTYDLDNTLENIIITNNKNIEKIDKKNGHGWQLDKIRTTLALTLEGKMGVKSWGGGKAIELDWKKRSTHKIPNEEDDDFREGTVNFQDIQREGDIEKFITPLAKGLVAKGKVHNEKLLKYHLMEKALLFQEVIRGIESTNISSSSPSWSPFKVRLDLTIAADASVTGAFARAGGELQIRFEWKRSSGISFREKNKLGKIGEKSRFLLNTLSRQIAMAVAEEPASKKLKFENFNLSIGVSVSGEVGIAEASGEIVTQVYFKSSKEEDLHALKSNAMRETNNPIPFLKNTSDEGLEQIALVSSDNFRKGLKKAVRFAEYFQKKLSKEKYKKSDWAVYSIAPSFTFSLNGDVGLTTLERTSGLELEYQNANF